MGCSWRHVEVLIGNCHHVVDDVNVRRPRTVAPSPANTPLNISLSLLRLIIVGWSYETAAYRVSGRLRGVKSCEHGYFGRTIKRLSPISQTTVSRRGNASRHFGCLLKPRLVGRGTPY